MTVQGPRAQPPKDPPAVGQGGSPAKRRLSAYGNLILSVALAFALLAASLFASKGIEILTKWLWDATKGEEPPFDVGVLVTVSGIVGAVSIIGYSVIDTYVTWRRAIREGR